MWKRIGPYPRKVSYTFYEATLVAIFKNHFLFTIASFYGKWKIPCNSVEIYDIINRPLNNNTITKMAIEKLQKFSKYGFKRMSDDDLRVILAFKNITDPPSISSYEYPAAIVSGTEKYFHDRGNIIRTLRNTFEFRDTEENRKECLKNLT